VDNIYALIRKQGKSEFETYNSGSEWSLDHSKTIGVIILAHGSKLKKANNMLYKVVATIKRKLKTKNVVAAYLQFCQPDLNKGIEELVMKNVKTIIIVPFFLFSGNHVTRDIPEILKEEQKKYSKVKFIYTKNLGDDSKIEEIVMNRLLEVLQK
jgi:sirohydrochlorin ferrochelatase